MLQRFGVVERERVDSALASLADTSVSCVACVQAEAPGGDQLPLCAQASAKQASRAGADPRGDAPRAPARNVPGGVHGRRLPPETYHYCQVPILSSPHVQ